MLTSQTKGMVVVVVDLTTSYLASQRGQPAVDVQAHLDAATAELAVGRKNESMDVVTERRRLPVPTAKPEPSPDLLLGVPAYAWNVPVEAGVQVVRSVAGCNTEIERALEDDDVDAVLLPNVVVHSVERTQ